MMRAGRTCAWLTAGLLLLFCLVAGQLRAAGLTDADKADIFSQANSFFNRANELGASRPEEAKELYTKALLRFEHLVAEGVRNGRLYYNIGNVYFRLGDIGRAILNYRRAARFIPNDPNLQQNLTYVLSQRQDKIEMREKEKVLKTLFFFHYDFPARVRLLLFTIFYSAFWLLLALRVFRTGTWLHWGLGISLALFLLFAGSLLVDHFQQAANPAGVLVAEETTARKGDGETYQPSFKEPLHAGTEFTLLEERGKWFHIELSDGRNTWVEAKSAALVGRETDG